LKKIIAILQTFFSCFLFFPNLVIVTPFSFFCKNIEKNPPFHSVSSASQIQTFNVAVVFKKMKICFTR